jgi:signal transduction histidine kinase
MIRRPSIVYGLLLAVWAVIMIWQVLEHNRVKEAARTALLNRARATATPLRGVIQALGFDIRSGRLVQQERLETALKSLVTDGELHSIALLNAAGEAVVSAGAPIDLDIIGRMQTGEYWDASSVMVVSRVDLGVVVEPRRDPSSGPSPNRPRPSEGASTNSPATRPTNSPPGAALISSDSTSTNAVGARPGSTNRGDRLAQGQGDGRSRRGRPPFWYWMSGMSEEERKSMVEKRGLHGLVIAMSTESFQSARTRDLWLRWVIGCFAGVSAIGFGFAWRNQEQSSELQMRLLRASELNSHLKGMNVAAAGLAHETRNPLNIIRGLAQIISKETNASEEIRRKSREITDEVDRVTGQLNEFINYSKPREVRRSPVALNLIVGDVARALNSDLEDKGIQLKPSVNGITVEADEQLLRQVLFNLLINAVQAVESSGEIQIVASKCSAAEASLEIRDNGPGVPPEQRAEIFKPYFTTHQKGTGLGLAVVQQIILAHGWDIEYIPNEPKGAIFRLSRLKLSLRS